MAHFPTPTKKAISRILPIFLICGLILPGPAYGLRKQQAVDSLPAEAQLAAGVEENAWSPTESAKWKVYGGETAALLVDLIGWREDRKISDLDSRKESGGRGLIPGMPAERARELLSKKSGEFLLVENAKGDFALTGEAGPHFDRLREQALDGILLEPLTADLVDREKLRIVELLKQMGLDLRSATRLKVQYPEGNFGIAARDSGTGKLVGFISAARGDDLNEKSGWGIVYIPYNVVDEQWRSKGIGRLLFESVLAAAAAARNPSVYRVIWEPNRTAYQIDLPLPAGAEEVVKIESAAKFLEEYRLRQDAGLLRKVEALAEREQDGLPMEVWKIPNRLVAGGALHRVVRVYILSKDTRGWIEAIRKKLPAVGKGEERTEFLLLPFPADGRIDPGVPTVVIKQIGVTLEYLVAGVVIAVESLGDLERQLSPQWIYALAVNEALKGKELWLIDSIPLGDAFAIYL